MNDEFAGLLFIITMIILLVVGAIVCIPTGLYFGTTIGYDEAGFVGSAIGLLAGGFAGIVATVIVVIVGALVFVASIFLGPFALAVAAIYYFFFRTEAL